MKVQTHHQGFATLVERLFQVARKPSNVIPLPPREPLFTERQIAEMSLKQLDEANDVLAYIGLTGAARANRLFMQRMRDQLDRIEGAQS